MPLAACQVILHQAFLQRPVTTHFIEKSRQAEVGGDAGCCEGIRTQQARQVGYTWLMIQERACVTDPCLPGGYGRPLREGRQKGIVSDGL